MLRYIMIPWMIHGNWAPVYGGLMIHGWMMCQMYGFLLLVLNMKWEDKMV